MSRFFIASRLSEARFPRAMAISILRFFPFVYTEMGMIVNPCTDDV